MYIAETELFMVEIYYEQINHIQKLIVSKKEMQELKYKPLSIKKISLRLGKEQVTSEENIQYFQQLQVQDFCEMKEY